jgi:hypothetical protein
MLPIVTPCTNCRWKAKKMTTMGSTTRDDAPINRWNCTSCTERKNWSSDGQRVAAFILQVDQWAEEIRLKKSRFGALRNRESVK